MSYCRFGEADVYIFEHVGGFWQCCACSLSEPGSDEDWGASADCATREEMLDHIAKHRVAGDYVPEHVDEQLRKEIADGRDVPFRDTEDR
jgi:hypothetical protein